MAVSSVTPIVFVNGCFDCLHAGHVRFLEFAAGFGRVVVGLNSDDSVKSIKGETRPIIREYDRREVLLAIRYVDGVTVFSDPTPIRLALRMAIDVYVVGPDHPTNCEVCDVVRSRGGTVIHAPEFAHERTSQIVRKILEVHHG